METNTEKLQAILEAVDKVPDIVDASEKGYFLKAQNGSWNQITMTDVSQEGA